MSDLREELDELRDDLGIDKDCDLTTEEINSLITLRQAKYLQSMHYNVKSIEKILNFFYILACVSAGIAVIAFLVLVLK